MKKMARIFLALTMASMMALTGCSAGGEDKSQPSTEPVENTGGEAETGAETESKDVIKVASLLNGFLGDKSFYDLTNDAMDMLNAEYGDSIEAQTIEMGFDPTKYEPTVYEFSEGDTDIIVLPTFMLKELCEQVAQEFPDKEYIIYDASVDYSAYDLPNVYSIEYKQNEGGFLAGALATKLTQSDLPGTNDAPVIGFIGGMENTVINDFLVGYIQGAQYVNPDVKVAISYVGDFANTAKGKELAIAQIGQQADIIFQVAGQAGMGAIDAAYEKGIYAIGVDGDQAMSLKESDPEKAAIIPTSVLKRVDNSLFRAISLDMEDKLEWGKTEALGIKDQAIGLAQNEYYDALVTEDVQALITEIEGKIIAGEIVVDTAFGKTADDIATIKNTVKP